MTTDAVANEHVPLLRQRKFEGAAMGRLALADMVRVKPVAGRPMNVTRIEAVNGDEVWMDMKRGAGIGGILGGMGGMGGGGMGGPGGSGRGGDGQMGGMQEMNSPEMQKQVRADFTRLLVAWLLTSPASSQVEFSYERELELKEGKADALRVTGADDFTMVLYVDQKTHRPVMLAYQALMPRRSAGGRSNEESPERKREPEVVEWDGFYGVTETGTSAQPRTPIQHLSRNYGLAWGWPEEHGGTQDEEGVIV